MENLKKKIKKKYGTISKFCRLSGMEINKVNKFFFETKNDPKSEKWKPVAEYIMHMIKITPRTSDIREITEHEKQKLNGYIIENYNGSNKLFCDVTGYDYSTVNQILTGRRKTKTELVMNILKMSE